jgi:energy-coupling factor transporter ATP-binding protein EcfA2
MNPNSESNPFSTRWTRPGALPYLFPRGADARTLVDRLRASGWRGQITGPHGSGKSTLVAALNPALRAAGRHVVQITLRDSQRRLSFDLANLPGLDETSIIVVDGYEQLSGWSRLQLCRLCTRRGWGLLVTSHVDVGLPEVFQTKVTCDIARQIVERLQQPENVVITDGDVAAALARHGGNMREALFTLYDLYELCRRRPVSFVSPPSSQALT